jgi:signal transduction histidine kinase
MIAYTTSSAGDAGRAAPVRATRGAVAPLQYLVWSMLLVAGYLALEAARRVLPIEPGAIGPWNPQAGLAVALVYVGGARYGLPLFVAALLAEALFRPHTAPALQPLLALAASVPLLLTGLALRWRTRGHGLGSVASTRDFLTIGAVGAMASALLYVLVRTLAMPGDPAPWTSLLHKWLGDYVGIVVLTPLAVLLLSVRPAVLPARTPLWLDAALFVSLLGAVLALLVTIEPHAGEHLVYLLFVPLIVLAMRRGYPAAAIGIAVVQLSIVLATTLSGRNATDAAAPELLMLVLGITTLALGAIASERWRVQMELTRRSAELRAQQQALSDAMRMSAASETASTLVHELSQPLSAIGSYARAMQEKMRRGLSGPQDMIAIADRIVAESGRTRESLQRIRDFFRSGTIAREPVELAPLIVDVLDALRDRVRALGITITTDVPPKLAPVQADRMQLAIVIHNLVGNAVDAASAAGPPRWIRIAAREHGQLVEVEVADSGPGIDASLDDSLFEPLATTKPSGMGLGLPISRTLIAAHGGRLVLASMHPTTFRFTLPTHG